MGKEKTYQDADTHEVLKDERSLVLFNDDHNTFDHVIESLIDVCEHNYFQAEQCALITHLKGKCGVKQGTFEELKPMHEDLGLRDLTVEIQ